MAIARHAMIFAKFGYLCSEIFIAVLKAALPFRHRVLEHNRFTGFALPTKAAVADCTVERQAAELARRCWDHLGGVAWLNCTLHKQSVPYFATADTRDCQVSACIPPAESAKS